MRCYNGCPDDELATIWKAKAISEIITAVEVSL